jgi:hypothetical protein
MNDQENRTRTYGSDGNPAFCIVKAAVLLGERIGIFENEKGSFETHVVLAQILRVLVFIPFKAHGRLPLG